ncbi:caspase, EACC1-associated type [Actinomadura oligospora]|uniref:caspase, EACC1-associated type n=1 Tax=Actinomadura oligospora TaxID=111804 RepID=UPI000686A384|nr:caspase family protein [Actinomadura oligospora]
MTDFSRSRAVLVGTAEYADAAFPRLPAAANSLAGMRAVLTDPSLCGWPDDRVTVESDPSDWRGLVRRTRVLARETEDVLLLYFVGHGVMLPRGELSLALTDTEADDPDLTGLEYRRVRDLLRDSPAATKIVILDCCYSGRAIEALTALDAVADSTDVRGVYTLTASDHTAHVVPLAEQEAVPTSFTGQFLALVRDGVRDGPESLTLGDLYVHLRRRLTAHGLPAPNQRGTDTADRYPFTRNPAHRRPPPPYPYPRSRPEPGVVARPRLFPAEPRGLWSTIPGVPALLPQETVGASALAFSPDGRSLVTGHLDGSVHLRRWSFEGSTPLRPVAGESGPISAVAVTSVGPLVAYAVPGQEVGLYSLESSGPEHRLLADSWSCPKGPVRTLAFTPDGRWLVAGQATTKEDSRTCVVWNVRTGGRLRDPEPAKDSWALWWHASDHAVTILPDGRVLTLQHRDGHNAVATYRLAGGQPTKILESRVEIGFVHGVEAAGISPDGRTIVTVEHGRIHYWRATDDGHLDGPTFAEGTPATSVVVGPEGRAAALWAPGEPLRVWDLHAFEQIGGSLQHSGQTRAVAFTPDGATLAVGDAEWPVRLWRPA